MKVWIDDARPMPQDYDVWFMSANAAINFIREHKNEIEEISLDHDSGEYNDLGGDYIKILDWMEGYEEMTGNKFTCIIKLHTMNSVARDNMMRIIKRRGWNYEF